MRDSCLLFIASLTSASLSAESGPPSPLDEVFNLLELEPEEDMVVLTIVYLHVTRRARSGMRMRTVRVVLEIHNKHQYYQVKVNF